MSLSSQIRALVLISLFGALLFACGSSGKDADQDPGASTTPTGKATSGPLAVTYVVTGVTEDGRKRPLVPGSEIRLTFADGRLGITAGCNSMGAAYVLEGTRLTVEGLATTEMACDPPLMEQDTWVAGLFASPVQLTTGNDAAIISGDVVLALTDREQVHPDKPLVGTLWVLDSIGSSGADGAVSSVPPGVTASVTFAPDGTVAVRDGCNSGSGSAEVAGETITWGDRVTTLIGCRPGSGEAEVEAAVRETLRGRTTFAIEEETLTITRGEGYLGFRASR